jgi:hypothetical protein
VNYVVVYIMFVFGKAVCMVKISIVLQQRGLQTHLRILHFILNC